MTFRTEEEFWELEKEPEFMIPGSTINIMESDSTFDTIKNLNINTVSQPTHVNKKKIISTKELIFENDSDRVQEQTKKKPESLNSGSHKKLDSEDESANLEHSNNSNVAEAPNSYKDYGASVNKNEKPPALTEGFFEKNPDLAESEYDELCNTIIPETSDLYKRKDVSMSKIPYLFDTPVPQYFKKNGWFNNEKTWKYITWAFSKCQTQSHKINIQGKEVTLAPYEFISGRLTSPKECFLTENEFRNQQNAIEKAGFIKKTPNSKTNQYTCYIWVTERFSNIDNQRNNQRGTNEAPTKHHESEDKKIRYKEDHLPLTPSSFGRLTDDLFSKEENKNKIFIHSGRYHNGDSFEVYLTQKELDECKESRGSIERIKEIIDNFAKWPGRKFNISNWTQTIKTWHLKNNTSNRIEENENLGKKIEDEYSNIKGWEARVYRDNLKDQKGILFEGKGESCHPIFIAFSEPNFKEKCFEVINQKKMKKRGSNGIL